MLHWSASEGKRDAALVLIEFGADPHLRDKKGNTALHKSARQGIYSIATLLIQHNVEVNARTPGLKITPLHQAVRFGHERIVRLLLINGAEVNAFSMLYGTPLHWAAETGNREIAFMLLEQGASLTLLDSHGLSPAERARLEEHSELAKMLAVAKVNSQKSELREQTHMSDDQEMQADCIFPQRMQRFGRKLVDAYIDNQMSTSEFLRQLTLTNSSYLELGQCIVGIYNENPYQ